MSLKPGDRVTSYEIVALLGAGGMGEVYRARDPRLGREVAIKVLPAAFAEDADRLVRFEQEARAAAALNHPNILAVHDVGRHDGAPFLVTEVLDGLTLREHVADGALPLRKALGYGIQLARGLAAAHEKGIVHRDLKPENVFVTADDRVKILDFGLAKLTQPEPGLAAASAVPTTPLQTQPGVVLGTVGYMSPEQVRGRAADHRSDIFALGAILYEMLSGQRAFHGETAMDGMTAILKEDPPPLGAGTRHIPIAVERIVARCLEKAPAARFKSADDLAFALEGLSTQSEATPVVAGRGGLTRRERIAWTVAAVSFLGAVALALVTYATRGVARDDAPEMRLQVAAPIPINGNPASFALSPDGTKLAFVTDGQLWVRSLESETARAVAPTAAAFQAFWSPDSRSIGFFTSTQLKRIDLESGLVRTLAASTQSTGGTWNSDGTIVFAPSPSTPLMRIGADGRGLSAATRLDPPRQIAHRFPDFLPDGRHFLFFALGPLEHRGVYVGSLDSPDTRRLLDGDAPAVFLPPHWVVLMRDGALLAQRLNLQTLQMEGDLAPLATRVTVGPNSFNAIAASSSRSGIIAYRAHAGERQSFWVDRSGRQVGTLGGPDPGQQQRNHSLSRDGDRLALVRTVNGNSDIWLIDGRGGQRRLTQEPVRDRSPVWSPDGRRIAFASERTGVFDIYERPVDGTGQESLLLTSLEPKAVEDWSSDGRILYQVQDPKTDRDLWVLPVAGDRKPLPVTRTPFAEQNGRFSPDSRWVAYQSDENGHDEVYVQAFPGPGGKIQVSTGGGTIPQWRRDGRELFYAGPNRQVIAVPIMASGTSLKIGAPMVLFTASPDSGSVFLASPDGQRFLVSTVTSEPAPVTLLFNWVGLRQ